MTIKLELAKKDITSRQIRDAQYEFDQLFRLHFADKQQLTIERILRLVPGKRMVVAGTWLNKPVVAKLFFAKHHAKRHLEKDLAGVEILRQNMIPTPALYYQGHTADRVIYGAIFEQLTHTKNLFDLWQEKKSVEDLMPLLESVILELATQHVLGVLQQDLHLKNFLVSPKVIYTLDGGQISAHPLLLSKKVSLQNLALFLSQLGAGVSPYQEKLFYHYAISRGWLLKPEDKANLFLMIKNNNNERWKKFSQKIFRNSTDFVCTNTWQTFSIYDRQLAGKELRQLLPHPELFFQHESAQPLKQGNSATVVKVSLDGKQYVVKRYNLKNILHRLRRTLRRTRAEASWYLAQKYALFGVRTATPVAFIEKKYLSLRGRSYFITEYIAGTDLYDYFMRHENDSQKTTQMIDKILTLLKSLAEINVTHGDLKYTNILIDHDENPRLIDLDGAKEHASLSSLQRGMRTDVRRLLKNFKGNPSLYQQFKVALKKGK